MAEWHIPPDYIVNNWTDELLDLMIEKLIARNKPADNKDMVSDTTLFRQLGKRMKVVKK